MKNKLMATAALCAALCGSAALREACATQYSKLGLITATKAAGKWDAIKSWIESSGYGDEWAACSYLSDDYPQFAAITNSVVTTGIATAEEVAAILSAARDTALPDALMVSRYRRDVAKEAGRVAWHGARVSLVEDTNTLTVVSTYADGTKFSEPFTVKKPASLAARMAAAKAATAKRRVETMPPGLVEVAAARDDAAATTNEVTIVTTP